MNLLGRTLRWLREDLASGFRRVWPLLKSYQTGLLLLTGLAGYMSSSCPVMGWDLLLNLTGSLVLAISGSTVLNMVYDRDIDARMQRTFHRPLPSGEVSTGEALALGIVLSLAGVAWAFWIDALYGAVVLAGLFFDVAVYTIWLKRRTAWSVVWGGIAGGMPVLAGRALGLGRIDWVGLMLALAVLLWIPTHIMTFSIRYRKDYEAAGVPIFPTRYGERITRFVIAISSILAALAMGAAAYGIGMTWGSLRILIVLGSGLFVLAFFSTVRPSQKIQFGLFKYASVYMLGSMLLVVMQGI